MQKKQNQNQQELLQIAPWQTQIQSYDHNYIVDLFPCSPEPKIKRHSSSHKQANLPIINDRKTSVLKNNKFIKSSLQNRVLVESSQNSRCSPLKARNHQSAHKYKKMSTKFQNCQQVAIQKFFVEGQCAKNKQNGRDWKKQSSFLRKHKFGDIRKSIHVPGASLIIKQVVNCRQDRAVMNFSKPHQRLL